MTSPAATAVCIVGTGRRTWRDEDGPTPEPLTMWEEVARAAATDAGASRDVLRLLDHVAVIHCQSWGYDDPGLRLADRLGLARVSTTSSILAGTSPQRMIGAAAEAMARNQMSAALIVGAEAGATRRRHDENGTVPPWSCPAAGGEAFQPDLSEWYLPTELRHGVLPAWLTFALLGQARWASRGGSHADHGITAQRLAAMSRVAAGNPDAWFRSPRTARELLEPSPSNRLITTPYTKHMTAFPAVDMAAANLLVTHQAADAWGIPQDRRVYLRGWGFARDASHIAARRELAGSPAMRSAFTQALDGAGLTVDDMDAFDLYSCFGSAVDFACDALGIDAGDPRPLTLTGGLPYHGGPGSNYMSHSTSHTVDHLRDHGGTALVTGVGMHMTKHVAAIWSTEPGSVDPRWAHGPQRAALPTAPGDRDVVDHADGPVTIDAASVVHHRDGSPWVAQAICTTPDGPRCYTRSTDADVMGVVSSGAWVGLPGTAVARRDGTNDLRL